MSNLLEPIEIKVELSSDEALKHMDDFTTFVREEKVSSDAMLIKAKEFVATIYAGEIPNVVPHGLSSYDNSIIAYAVKNAVQEAGYYGAVTKSVAEALAKNIGSGVVLDPLAGEGYFAKALREAGVKTIATDNYSWSTKPTNKQSFENLEALDSLKKYGDEITHLLISWAPYGSTIDVELLELCRERFPHIIIINVGEHNGCTGSLKFWKKASTIKMKHEVPYSSFYGLHDFVEFCK